MEFRLKTREEKREEVREAIVVEKRGALTPSELKFYLSEVRANRKREI